MGGGWGGNPELWNSRIHEAPITMKANVQHYALNFFKLCFRIQLIPEKEQNIKIMVKRGYLKLSPEIQHQRHIHTRIICEIN